MLAQGAKQLVMRSRVARLFRHVTLLQRARGDTSKQGQHYNCPGAETCDSTSCCEVPAKCDTFDACSADRPVHKGSTVNCTRTRLGLEIPRVWDLIAGSSWCCLLWCFFHIAESSCHLLDRHGVGYFSLPLVSFIVGSSWCCLSLCFFCSAEVGPIFGGNELCSPGRRPSSY